MKNITAIDLFCGAGGLTHGLINEGINVVAGVDSDLSCKYAYEKNNGSVFVHKEIEKLSAEEITALYPGKSLKLLVGCAPCQPFSKYAKGKKGNRKDGKWKLLYEFTRIIKAAKPDLISMENVPGLKKYKVFRDFVESLEEQDYYVSHYVLFCPDYGIPQSRTRLVLFASKFGKVKIIEKTFFPKNYKTVKNTIGHLAAISDGDTDSRDPLHRASKLSALNKKRIINTPKGGGWKDWDESLISGCHKRKSGKSYCSVYGRMNWDTPAPTMTTQCYGYGNGRFGHPDQHRAISLREAALIQTFPEYYDFIDPDSKFSIRAIGRHIGNAVPVELGRVIAESIKKHLEEIDV